VVFGAIGVGLGFPLADPIVGLIITAMIFGIVWQSARAVFTRLLDGVDPGVMSELKHSIDHVPGIISISNIRARWMGHRLLAEADIEVAEDISVTQGIEITDQLRQTVGKHLPALSSFRIGFTNDRGENHAEDKKPHSHEHGDPHEHGHSHHD